jgi:hypothetical protein
MDPNETLRRLREMARDAVERFDRDEEVASADAAEMAEAFQVLDQWITEGGFLPREWEKKT